MKKLQEQIEQAAQLIDELNNLDFTKKEEDAAFVENLERLEALEKELGGEPQMVKPQTKKYLH